MKESRAKFSISERRSVLKVLGVGATLALPGWALGENSLWAPEELPVTPQQTEGPFYPAKTIEQQLFNDTDLSQKIAGHEFAKGQRAVVEGVIKDRAGRPLRNSVVEVWQACATGRYNHKRDAGNVSLLDNNFQFWGRSVTGEDGRYSFTSIIPGKYPGRTGRHIHYRVDSEGQKRCSTQCYFSDFGEDNMRDGIYRSLTKEERNLVTVEFDKSITSATAGAKSPADNRRGGSGAGAGDRRSIAKAVVSPVPWKGQFDIVLAK